MSDPIDVSKDRSTNWDKEIAAGHLMRKQPNPEKDVSAGHHIQGVPVTAAEEAAREVPAARMKHVMETGYYPDDPRGKAFSTVSISFDKDGNVIR